MSEGDQLLPAHGLLQVTETMAEGYCTSFLSLMSDISLYGDPTFSLSIYHLLEHLGCLDFLAIMSNTVMCKFCLCGSMCVEIYFHFSWVYT